MSQGKKLQGMERLEDRSVMAGNVWAGVVGGELRIVGDNWNNAVEVSEFAPNWFRVSSLDANSWSPTRINGRTFQDFYVAGDRVNMQGGGGADQLVVRNAGVASLNVDGGAGADSIVVQQSTVYGGNARIVAGDNWQFDADRVAVRRNDFRGGLEVRAGAGNDYVEATDNLMASWTLLDGGNGWDQLVTRRSNRAALPPTIGGFEWQS